MKEKPTDATELEAYEKKNDKAWGYITDHLTRHALTKVRKSTNTNSAKTLWEAIKEAYENKGVSNL